MFVGPSYQFNIYLVLIPSNPSYQLMFVLGKQQQKQTIRIHKCNNPVFPQKSKVTNLATIELFSPYLVQHLIFYMATTAWILKSPLPTSHFFMVRGIARIFLKGVLSLVSLARPYLQLVICIVLWRPQVLLVWKLDIHKFKIILQ